MNTRKKLMSTAVAGVISIFLSTSVSATSSMGRGEARPDSFWWPDKLNLEQLRAHDSSSNPHGDSFDYARAFASVDIKALKADIEKTLTTSQAWWPADWGHYGGLMIRSAWHSSGTYRTLGWSWWL